MKKSIIDIKLCLLALVLCVGISSSAQISLVKSITCYGDNDGQLQITPDFGTSPYTFAWSKNGGSTFSTDNVVKALGPGSYTVTVLDNASTSKTYTYVLTEPTAISNLIPIPTTSNSSWPNNNGSITLTTTGGNGGFSYFVKDSISRKDTTITATTLSGLASGTYYIKTTDVEGCYRNDTVRVGELAKYNLIGGKDFEPGIPDTTACYKNVATTSIKPDTLNTTFPVYVSFDGVLYKTLYGYTRPGDTTNIYLNGTTPVPTYVANNSPLYVIQTDIISTGPHAGSDTLTLAASAVSNTFEPGFHIMEVYTSDGKGFRYSWDVDSVVAPVSINYTQTNNTCYGDKDGTLVVRAQGSYQEYKSPFTYTVSPTITFNSITANGGLASGISAKDLPAGIYTITATDWAGCKGSQSVTITQPDEPMSVTFDVTKVAKCPYSVDGEVSVHKVDNSIPPLTYQWSNGDSTQSLTDVQAGTYTVTVTDANKCTATDSITVGYTQKSCFYNIVTPNGDGYNDYFDLSDMCAGGIKMNAKVFNERGAVVATLNENNPKWDAKDPANPPTGPSSTYTAFVELVKDGITIAKFAESFSVIYSK